MLKGCKEEANNKNINWEFFGSYLLGGCCAIQEESYTLKEALISFFYNSPEIILSNSLNTYCLVYNLQSFFPVSSPLISVKDWDWVFFINCMRGPKSVIQVFQVEKICSSVNVANKPAHTQTQA